MRRERLAAVLVAFTSLCAACAAIVGIDEPRDRAGGNDSGAGTDGSFDDGQTLGDAARDGGALTDEAGDASAGDAIFDSAVADSGPPDSGACNFQQFACNGGSGNFTINPPTTFCWHQTNNGVNGPNATPGGCQTCGTYTCACVLAALPTFCNVKSCADTNDEVVVMCQ